ncbi:MAG: (2Fe-2S) ferredoxin domain-containing protein [Gammaproteobacteria bacterium]|nr:(2Fe-2S) ferredoxin domain-containing protein [Gammaproteobacteria bacterium]
MGQRLIICNNRRLTSQKPSCGALNAHHSLQLEKLIAEQQIPISIEYRKCLGQCDRGPNIRLAPSGNFFHNVTDGDLPMIIDEIKRFIAT